jgi:hypothetical protein
MKVMYIIGNKKYPPKVMAILQEINSRQYEYLPDKIYLDYKSYLMKIALVKEEIMKQE